ncbi:MAG: BspA family leucine-rich repeat surface protein, partial [Oscillospiraceae bacterium]|nr:BspA family leucine-rich repeat surface protein [Oscillospiraceae bacterium]
MTTDPYLRGVFTVNGSNVRWRSHGGMFRTNHLIIEGGYFVSDATTGWGWGGNYPGLFSQTRQTIEFEGPTTAPVSMDRFFTSNTLQEVRGLQYLDTSNTTSMSGTFSVNNLGVLHTIEGLEAWDTSNVTTMANMFSRTAVSAARPSVTELDLSGWDTSRVTDMSAMFRYNRSLTDLNVTGWDTRAVLDMRDMFGGV